jgi:hypothetical protein
MASAVVDWDTFGAGRSGGPDESTVRRPMNWSQLADGTPPPRRWIYPGWLSYDPTLLVGPGGVGKTLLAQHLGTALATGSEFFEKQVCQPLTVLMWACEDDHDELWRRQVAICGSLNVSMADLQLRFILEPRRGRENTLLTMHYAEPAWTPLMGELTEQVNDYKADVLLLDNVGQTFGANENDRHHVTRYINGILGMTDRPFCPLLMAHPARHSGSEYAGSAAWENAVRMRWLFGEQLPGDDQVQDTEDPDADVRYLSRRKSNYSAKDWRKFRLVDGALQLDAKIEGEASMASARSSHVVLDAFRRIRTMGLDTSASTHASNYLPKIILAHRLNQGLNARELGKGMSDLMLDGALKVGVVGTYANRNPKQGLVEPTP